MRWRPLVGIGTLVFLPGVGAGQTDLGEPGGWVLLFAPFGGLAQSLIDTLVDVLMATVTIHPNPPVAEIHRLTLIVAATSSVLVVAAAGIYHITGIEIGVQYEAVRRILPRLLIGLGFAAVALPVLQVFVDLADAFVQAFRPEDPLMVEQLAGLTTGLVVVGFINTWLLLALVLLFVVRNVYLAFIAAVAPLVAVGWSVPNTRPYAQSFISIWFALLAAAPADVIVLRFSLAMLQGSGAFGLQPVSNWILGTASFALMLWIPYQLYAVSQGLIGGRGLASQMGESWGRRRPPRGGAGGSGGAGGLSDAEMRREHRDQRRRDRDQGRW